VGALGCSVAVLAACSSSTTGHGRTSAAAPQTGVSLAGPTAFPSSVATQTAPASSAGATACGSNAYCDDFSNPKSGWTVENQAHYFAQYDPYHGGTYRIGERTQATAFEDAPVQISSLSHDYSVQVDVDAIPGTSMPGTDSFGIGCWLHQSDDGQSTSGFIFLVDATSASIGLWDNSDGSYHQLAKQPVNNLAGAGVPDHLTAQCLQGSSGGGAAAQLSLSINGTQAVTASYANSVQNYPWSVGEHVALLASGANSDVFYDNFKITSKCSGGLC
jgi:hypothetical protein